MVNMETIVGLLLCFSIISEAQLQFSQEMSPGFVFSWDYDDSHITIQLTGPTLGWIGIGFSTTETMAQSDLIIAGVQDEEPYAWDAYSPMNGVVEIDVEQNLSIISGIENDTHTTVTVKRPLAGIGKDIAITGGVNNVIWAYGRADKFIETRRSDYHGNDRGHQKIILINKNSNPPQVVQTTSYTTKLVMSTTAAETMAEESDEMDSDTKLPFSVTLDKDQTVQLRWNFDKEYITLQLIAPSTGWIGVGLSQTASMFGADLIIMGKSNKGLYALDANAEKNGVPEIDEMQNVDIISGSENGTHTIMTVKRKLVTCDDDDMSIKEGTYRVIWAYGGSDLDTDVPTELHYHGLNRGAKSLKLINPGGIKEEEEAHEKYFDIRASNLTVPPVDTYYLCRAIEIPNYLEKRHIVRISPYLQPGNEKNIHHILVYLCNGELNPDIVGKHLTCYSDINNFALGCVKTLTGWAVGQSDLRFPKDVGFPLGGKNTRYVILQTHYDNPEMKEFEDSSGMRFYYSKKLRKKDAGLLTIASTVSSIWAPPNTKKYRVDGHCSETCLSKGMKDSGINEITVIATALHAHLAGSGMRLHHYRNGKELSPLAKDDYYDFDYQELQYVEDGMAKVQKGDSMAVQCDYDTTGRTNVTTGGLSTRNEMCIAFLIYYPELKLDFCDSAPKLLHDPSALLQLAAGLNISVSQMGRNPYGAMDIMATVLNQVEWTDEKRKFAEKFMNNLNRSPLCVANGSWLMKFSDDYPVPKYEEYVDEDECKENASEESSTDKLRETALVGVSAIILIVFAARMSLRKS